MTSIDKTGPLPIPFTAKIISVAAKTIVAVTVVACVALALIAYYNQLPLLYAYEIYGVEAYYLFPPAALGIGILLEIVAKTIKYFSRQKQSQDAGSQVLSSTLTQSVPPLFQEQPSVPPLQEQPSLPEKEFQVLSKLSELHPKMQETAITQFQELPLLEIDTDKEAQSCFLLFMGDFLGLETEGYPSNTLLSLSFLLKHLPLIENSIIEKGKLSNLIHNLNTSYQFESYRAQLGRAFSLEEYQSKRQQLSRWILETLQRDKTLVLDGGYNGEPSGHAIALSLTLEKDGRVKGLWVNTGEGLQYHTQEVGEANKYHALELGAVSIEALQRSPFFEMLIDLQMRSLIGEKGEKTSFGIEDVYQVLLPVWPGRIKADKGEAYTAQSSGSCTTKPYLNLMKRLLGEKDFSNVKIYLGIMACTTLLAHASFDAIDEKRLQDILAKFNRTALSLDGKKILDPSLKEAVLQVTALLNNKVKETKQNTSPPVVHALGPSMDQGDYKFPLTRPLTVIPKRSYNSSYSRPLPKLDQKRSSDYFRECAQMVKNAFDGKQFLQAKIIAHEALFALPNPSDPFWSTKRPENETHYLSLFTKALLNEKVKERKRVMITPNEAVLYLKALTITLSQAQMAGVPDVIINAYREKTQTILQEVGHHYVLTHPAYADTYFDCLKELGELEGEECKVTLKKHFSFYDDEYLLEEQKYESLKELRKNHELRYLSDFLSTHPDFKQKVQFDTEDPIDNILDLYHYNAYFHHRFSYQPFSIELLDSYPAAEEIRLWNTLRHLHLDFLFASYFVGDATRGFADWQSFDFKFDGYRIHRVNSDADKTPEKKREIVIERFKPKNLEALHEGLFFDTFTTFSDPMSERLMHLVDSRSPFLEKSRQTQNEQLLFYEVLRLEENFNLSPDEIQSLLSIRTYDALMIPQLIAFFSKNFRRLQDPRFQALFSHFLFSLNQDKTDLLLREALQSSSLVKDQLLNFIESSLDKTEELKWVDAHLFFIRTLAQVTSFLSDCDQKELVDRSLKMLESKIQALSENKDFPVEKKGNLAATLISLIPYLEGCKESDGVLFWCKKAKDEVVKNGTIISLQDHLQWREDYEIGDLKLSNAEEPKGILPNWIVSHNDYIFERNYPVREVRDGLYEFTDEKKNAYQIATDGRSISISRKIDGKFCPLQREPFRSSLFPNKDHPCVDGYFTEHVHVWQAPKGGEARIFSRQSDSLLAIVKRDGVFHPTDNRLRLATNYQAPVITYLERMAPKREILAWKNQNDAISFIEIPSLGIKFEFDGQHWKSLDYPGYFLDSTLSPSLEPFTHYIILRNRAGNRLAVVPNYGTEAKKQNAMEIPKFECGKITKTVSLFTYPLDPKGAIKKVENTEHHLYLIYLAMRKFDFKFAQTLVNQLKKQRPDWDKQNTQWIKELDLGPGEDKKLDMQPKAVSLRLQLRLLQKELSSVSLEKKQIEGLKKDYFQYLQLRKHTVACPLSTKEELKCIKLLSSLSLSEKESYQISLRRHFLSHSPLPQTSFFLEKLPEEKTNSSSLSYEWIDSNIEKRMRASIDDPRPVIFYLRSGSTLVHNFLYYYKIARSLPNEHQLSRELYQFLQFTRFDDDAKQIALRSILLNVLTAPDAFPTLEELLQEPLAKALKKVATKTTQAPLSMLTFQESYYEGALKHHGIQSSKRLESTPLPSFTRSSLRDITQKPLPIENYLISQKREERSQEIRAGFGVLEDMETFFKKLENDDPCVNREFSRLIAGTQGKKDLLRKELVQDNPNYLLDLNKIDRLSHNLQSLAVEYKVQLKEKKKQILQIAHAYPEKLLLEKNGELLKPLSLHELIIHFGTGDDHLILASNPSLDAKALTHLKQDIYEYLLLSTELQRILTLGHSLEEIEGQKEPAAVKALSAAFTQLALAKRVYDPSKEQTHLLVFEYFGKLLLRQDQYEALISMVGNENDMEFEARTGFGKSKVLIPLWLYLKSRKNKATMMTVPNSLFNAQLKHLREVLGDSFDSLIVPIQFNRAQANDLKFLKRLYKKLEDAKQNHKILLISVSSLHGIANLKLKELHVEGKGKEDLELQTMLIRISKMIAEQMANFFDESKVCFDPQHRHDYAVGPLVPVDLEKVATACDLYHDFFIQSDLSQKFDFEFLSEAPKKDKTPKKILNQETYETDLLPKLAELAMCRFHIPKELEDVVFRDLKGYYTPACEAFYRSLSKIGLESYDRIKKQLTVHLRRSLYRKFRDGYGFYTGTRLAIPYLDGTPKSESEFSELEDYIDFTIQANLKKPFAVADVTAFLDQLKVKALSMSPKEISELPEIKWLKTVINVPLGEINENQYSKITDVINQNLEMKLGFIKHAVLSQIKIYHKKITSTSFNLISAINHIQAASGTVNPDILPPRIATKEDKTAVIDNLMALWKNQKNIIDLTSGSAKEQLKGLLVNHPETSVIIDVAGTFRELEPTEIAQAILENHRAKGVLLYDDAGRELVYDRENRRLSSREESLLDVQDLFIFIRKSKAIGTDTQMMLTAHAIVTIDKDTGLDFLFQGTGRMRKLREGLQKVKYALTQEDASLIFGENPRLFKHMIVHAARVQGLQKGEATPYILRLFFDDLVDKVFRHEMHKCSPKERKELTKAFEGLIVKSTQTQSLATLRQTQSKLPAHAAIGLLKASLLGEVKQFCQANKKWSSLFDLAKIEKDFDAFVRKLPLPKMMSLHSGGDAISSVEVDATQMVEAEEMVDELDAENTSDKSEDFPAVRFKPAVPLRWDGDYSMLLHGEPNEKLLGIPVYFSPNFQRISEDSEENKKAQKPAYQYLVQKNADGELKILLLDLHDAAIVLKKMENSHQRSSQQENYLYSGTRLIASDGGKSPYSSKKGPEILSVSLIRKLYSAHTLLTKGEKKYLNSLEASESQAFFKRIQQLLGLWPHLTPFFISCKEAIEDIDTQDIKGKRRAA